MDTIEAIARKITPTVRIWSYTYDGTRGTRGCQRGVQALKNEFVDLTQFQHDPVQRRLQWKEDMEQAAVDAVSKACPNWKMNANDLIVYNTIQKAKEKALWNNRRRHWLLEKARAWLLSLAREVKSPQINPDFEIHVAGEVFHARETISIAYYIFLRGAGEIESFVRYLENSGNKNVIKFTKAYKGHLEMKYKRCCLAVFDIYYFPFQCEF